MWNWGHVEVHYKRNSNMDIEPMHSKKRDIAVAGHDGFTLRQSDLH